jgi:hypothetical protein
LVILRVTISIGATSLKKFGIVGRFTASRIAAILIGFEHRTWVVTTARGLQLIGTLSIDISSTSYTAGAAIRRGAKIHSNIEPINKRDVEEVQIVKLVKSEFGEGVWRYTIGLALEKPTAITSLTTATPGTIEITPCSRPNATPCGSSINIKAPCFTLIELPAATRYSPGPNCEGTVAKLCKLLWFVREMRRGLYRVSLGEVMAFWEVA